MRHRKRRNYLLDQQMCVYMYVCVCSVMHYGHFPPSLSFFNIYKRISTIGSTVHARPFFSVVLITLNVISMQHEREFRCEGKKLVFYDVEGVSKSFIHCCHRCNPKWIKLMWNVGGEAFKGVEENLWWEYSVFPLPSLQFNRNKCRRLFEATTFPSSL